MYLLSFYYAYSRINGSEIVDFLDSGDRTIPKWTVWTASPGTHERLHILAAVCLGRGFISSLERYTPSLVGKNAASLHVAFTMARHPPRDILPTEPILISSGFQVSADGTASALTKKDSPFRFQELRHCAVSLGSGVLKNFALAYGPIWRAMDGDSFDFSGEVNRARRFITLFDETTVLTDSVAFLERLQYRCGVGRPPALKVRDALCRELEANFKINTALWRDRQADYKKIWAGLTRVQRRFLVPVIDAIRHIMDASPRELDPLDRPGVIIMRLLPAHTERGKYISFFSVMDRLFPKAQFILSLPENSVSMFPAELLQKRLDTPHLAQAERKAPKTKLGTLPRGTTLLVDVDSRIPNVALMKLANWIIRKEKRRVRLVRGDNWQCDGADHVYASCVFHFPGSLERVRKLQERFGAALTIGGSGVDLERRLPVDVEMFTPHYELYPELGDRAIGFLTRGCSFSCSFCIVPKKEGKPRQVSDLDGLLQKRRKLVLLDDNILAHPQADEFLEEMADKRIEVNFNQTLDLRLINKRRAGLLRRITVRNYLFTRPVYHFSLNDCSNLDIVKRKYPLLGFGCKDNVEFVCMYGFNTTLAEDVERFRFLRSLPGAYVFVQEYRPIIGGAPPTLAPFFDHRADQLIDALVSICFPQNMKSMEKYYRWLSKKYVETFGKVHNRLVDTIFRYNNRDQRARYMARMHAA